MPVAKAPGSCELNKLLNREWAVQIKPKGAKPEDYIFVRGLDNVDVNVETNSVDSSDIDSDGWKSETKTSRSLIAKLAGKFAIKNGDTVLEPSHKLLRETGEALGSDGEVDTRMWRTDGTEEGWEFTATNKWSAGGGNADDLRAFTADLQSTCAPRKIKPVEEGAETKESVYVVPAPAESE